MESLYSQLLERAAQGVSRVNHAFVEGSNLAVLVFVTENYCIKVAGAGRNGADDNCKKEFDYASRRKGIEKMIAAVMEPRGHCRRGGARRRPVFAAPGLRLE